MAPSTHRPAYQYMLERLVTARKAARLTQEAVADALGTTQTAISKIERGERRIDPVELAEFAALYAQDVGALLPDLPTLALPKTVELRAPDATVLKTLADEQGESEETILHHALKAYAGSTKTLP